MLGECLGSVVGVVVVVSWGVRLKLASSVSVRGHRVWTPGLGNLTLLCALTS